MIVIGRKKEEENSRIFHLSSSESALALAPHLSK